MNSLLKKIVFVCTLFLISSPASSEIIIEDKFDSQKTSQYDRSHIKLSSMAYLTETNGNKFVRLTTKIGQLSHFNEGDTKYIKDRIELGTKRNRISKTWSDIDGVTLWWSFDVKKPISMQHISGNEITFTQLKTIDKDKKKKQCHPGMPFRINYRNDYSWIAVTNGWGRMLGRKIYKEDILDNQWTNFKVMYHFSKTSGEVEVFRNGRNIFSYSGNTIFDDYPECTPISDLDTYVRIGIYRSSKRTPQYFSPYPFERSKDDALDFDNFIICKGKEKECPIKTNVDFDMQLVPTIVNNLPSNAKMICTNALAEWNRNKVKGTWISKAENLGLVDSECRSILNE